MDAATARTLYNLIDACWPGRAGDQALHEIERAVRQAGPPAARRLWLACRVLDWEPLLRGPVRARFWRLPPHARAAAARRFERSRLGFRSESYRLIAGALGDQPSPGA